MTTLETIVELTRLLGREGAHVRLGLARGQHVVVACSNYRGDVLCSEDAATPDAAMERLAHALVETARRRGAKLLRGDEEERDLGMELLAVVAAHDCEEAA